MCCAILSLWSQRGHSPATVLVHPIPLVSFPGSVCWHTVFTLPGQTTEPPATCCPWPTLSTPSLSPHISQGLSPSTQVPQLWNLLYFNLDLKAQIFYKMNYSLLAWQTVEITSKRALSAFLANPQNLRHYSVQKLNCDKPTSLWEKNLVWLFVLGYYRKIIFLVCVIFNTNQHVHSRLRCTSVKPLPICCRTVNLHWRLECYKFISWTVIWSGSAFCCNLPNLKFDVELNNLNRLGRISYTAHRLNFFVITLDGAAQHWRLFLP